MAFKRWGCEFDGPWPNTDILKPRPGIWVIWCKAGNQWEVLEVGESRNVRASVLRTSEHYGKETPGSIHYSASYTGDLPDEARRELAIRVERVSRPRKYRSGEEGD